MIASLVRIGHIAAMDFEAWRRLKKWTLDRAADEMRVAGVQNLSNINASIISRHERGIHHPRPNVIARYAEITANAVTAADWHRLASQGGRDRCAQGRKTQQEAA